MVAWTAALIQVVSNQHQYAPAVAFRPPVFYNPDMAQFNWDEFAKKTANREPVSLLVEAVKLLKGHEGNALDLGCGAGVDARFLSDSGYGVEAVDGNAEAVRQARKNCPACKIEKHNFINYRIPVNKFKIIFSWHALPFISKKEAKRLLLEIQSGLMPGGYFVFGLFGPEDDWAHDHKGMSFWTTEELKTLLQKIEFIKLSEERGNGPGALGGSKFWHKIQGIGRKA